MTSSKVTEDKLRVQRQVLLMMIRINLYRKEFVPLIVYIYIYSLSKILS